MPTCAGAVKVGWSDGEGPLNNGPLGASTEHKKMHAREFYAERSRWHPPKNRVPLLQRETDFMVRLREERNANGYSEAFSPRRRFPIVAPPPPEAEEPAPEVPP